MHLSREEALLTLECWQRDRTSLLVFFTGPVSHRKVRAMIGKLTDSAVTLNSDSEVLHIDLEGAEFNSHKTATRSDYAAYLVCKLQNGGCCYFYVPRAEPQ
jgi:hypothetical protein